MALFGGNPENMDRDAALAAFLATFKTEDKKIRDKLIVAFIGGFLFYYRLLGGANRKRDKREETEKEMSSNLDNKYALLFEEGRFFRGEYGKPNELSFAGWDPIKKAEKLGNMLGGFLAFIESSVASSNPKVQQKIDRDYDWLISEFKPVPSILKESGISIKHKFIANRVRRIAREKAGQLTDRQQRLLAEIAAMFW